MTKGQRAKYDRKQERLRKTMPKAIPLHEHSADLTAPGDDAFVSAEKRAELTKSARVARRKSIREENFLKSM
jgi:large subunit ribosomal protein L54